MPAKYTIVPAVDNDGAWCGCWTVETKRQQRERERAGQPVYCPAHGTAEPDQGTLDMVTALSAVHMSGGRTVHQVPIFSEAAFSGKFQGRLKGKYKKGRDLRIDLLVERTHGALESHDPDDVVGVEVDGPGHSTTYARYQDAKKDGGAPYHVHRVAVIEMEGPR